jgi:hypothetical protein
MLIDCPVNSIGLNVYSGCFCNAGLMVQSLLLVPFSIPRVRIGEVRGFLALGSETYRLSSYISITLYGSRFTQSGLPAVPIVEGIYGNGGTWVFTGIYMLPGRDSQ